MTLREQLFNYCKQENLFIQPSEIHALDYEVSNGNRRVGVKVCDWKRALGVNVVIQAEKIKKMNNLLDVIILTNYCSDPAESFAKKINVPLFRHWEEIKIVSKTE